MLGTTGMLEFALTALLAPGIYHGSLSYSSQEPGDGIIDSAQLLPYPAMQQDSEYQDSPLDRVRSNLAARPDEMPVSIALTAYHVLLLYPTLLRVVRPLDDKVIYEEQLDIVSQPFWPVSVAH